MSCSSSIFRDDCGSRASSSLVSTSAVIFAKIRVRNIEKSNSLEAAIGEIPTKLRERESAAERQSVLANSEILPTQPKRIDWLFS